MGKIYHTKWPTFWESLELDKTNHPVISVVGAGGKTSLIHQLSGELSDKRMNHIILTTTHMWPVRSGKYTFQSGAIGKDGKLLPPTAEELKKCLEMKWPLLIEADGSRGLPCKAPELWEPVIIKETTHVFAVIGASALGKKVAECCHRPGRVMELLGCDENHTLTLEDMAVLAWDNRGLHKGVGEGQSYGLVINQVDDEACYEKMLPLAESCEARGLKKLWFTKLNAESKGE